jgi:two-component sensor histidine kinase
MITLRTGKAQRHVPMAVERSDGRRVWISVNAEPLCPQKQSDIAGVVVSFRDMTREREREERIREYAEEREHLLTEINHRVKNNLYTVEALANIELRATGKGKHEALQDIISRVRAISLVHQKLYSSGDFEEVKADEYLRDLVRALASASYPSPSGNAIECRAEALSLPPKKITSLGLIVSELITNTVKHSRSPAETSITLSLRREGEQAVLDYRDTGGGLPPEVTSIDQLGPGTGMRLVKMLAKDLEGEVSIPDRPAEKTDDTGRGARFRVVFPLETGAS